MDAQPTLRLIDFSHRALTVNLQDVTHADSLAQPAGGGNCINWVLGHIVVHRDRMLGLLGRPTLWDEATSATYRRGSAAITGEGEGVLPLERLVETLGESHARVREALAAADQAALSAPAGSGTVAESLLFLAGHECYHVGQVAILRRTCGREGAIK